METLQELVAARKRCEMQRYHLARVKEGPDRMERYDEGWYVLYSDARAIEEENETLKAELARYKKDMEIQTDALERIARFDCYTNEWPEDIYINAPPSELATFALQGEYYPTEKEQRAALAGEESHDHTD